MNQRMDGPGAAAPPAGPGTLMAAEIGEQPAVLAGLLGRAGELSAVARQLDHRAPRFVLLAARGTSDHAALYAKYLVEIAGGLPAGLVSPSTMTVYRSRPDLTGVLYVSVSQSGASPDLAESTAVARACGATTVALTNTVGSPLAEAAEFAVDLGAGPERAVAATKTYTAQLLALYLLLGGAPGPAAALPDAAAATLAGASRVNPVSARYRDTTRLVVTGRGYSYPTAREGALKLMETCYLSAHAYSTADLLHGPVAMLDREVPVIAVVSPGPGGRAATPVLARLRDNGIDVLEVGGADLPVAGAQLPEQLRPVVEILPLQQLAWRLALDRGVDPDAPRALSKVTRTR
jgi:glucosamine--fructose-6-phosphate aminotransferase (isomerizing)